MEEENCSATTLRAARKMAFFREVQLLAVKYTKNLQKMGLNN